MQVILLVRYLAIIVCTICLFYTLKRIFKGDKNILCFAYLLIYLFFVLPLFVCSISSFEYTSFIMANEALKDTQANAYYCLFVTLLAIILNRSIYKNKDKQFQTKKYVSPRVSNLAFLFILFDFLLIIIKNGIEIIAAGYGARLSDSNYQIFEPLMGVSMLFYLILIHYTHKMSIRKIIGTVLMFLLIFIHGKRFIAAQLLVLVVYDLFLSGKVTGRVFVFLGILSTIAIVGLAYFYGVVFKNNTSSLVEYLLIDMSRHYTMIYQIFCKLHHKAISVHQFDAIGADLLFFVPRFVWKDKMYPFSNAITRSLVGLPVENTNIGWATTITVFSDFFDSFGLIGLILVVVILIFMSKKINNAKRNVYKVLGLYIVMNMLTVQFSAYIIPSLIFVIIIVGYDFIYKYQENKKKRAEALSVRGNNYVVSKE